MKTLIYRELLSFGFRSMGRNNVNHPDIVKTFGIEGSGQYVEIYLESFGLSVHLYGKGLMSGYYPHTIDIIEKSDVKDLNKFLLANEEHFKVLSN